MTKAVRHISVFGVICLIAVLFGSQSAESIALGNAFTARSGDPLTLSRSPSSGWQYGWTFAADYSKLNLALEDNIFSTNLAAIYSPQNYGFGVLLSADGTSVYESFGIDFPMMMKVKGLSIGLSPRIAGENYHISNFRYDDDYVAQDPLFNDGSFSYSYGLSAGLSYDIEAGFTVAVSAVNVVPPKIGLVDKQALETEYRFGLCYHFQAINSVLLWDVSYIEGAPIDEELSWGMGIENKSLSENFILRSGISSRDLNFGIGFRPATDAEIAVAYSYPFGKLRKLGGDIRVGIKYNIRPPVPKSDLSVRCDIPRDVYFVGDTAIFNIGIVNTGQAKSEVSNLTLKLNNSIYDDKRIEEIAPGDELQYEYRFLINIPENIRGEAILETESTALSCKFEMGVAQVPECKMELSKSRMALDRLSYSYQDEGITPVIFFDENKSDVPSRFNYLLDIIVSRLSSNPDIQLEISGYVSPGEAEGNQSISSELAQSRAQSVYDELIVRDITLADRISMAEHWDIHELRLPREGLIPRQRSLYEAENRRAELIARIRPSLSAGIDSMVIAMQRNPGLYIVICGDDSEGDKKNALERALRKERTVRGQIPEIMHSRLLPSIARMENNADTAFSILSIDGLLFKPRVVHASRDYEPKQHPITTATLNYNGEDAQRWRIDIHRDGQFYFNLVNGQAKPPKSFKWDFRTKEGDILPLAESFTMSFSVDDYFGQTVQCKAPQIIKTEVEGYSEITRNLLLVQFEFDRPSPQSKYLEDRLFRVAESIVETIKDADSTWIIVEGHTDIIGTIDRNQRLSEQRASSTLENLLLAISLATGEDSVSTWLAKNNAQIQTVGHSSEIPYSVILWEAGEPIKRLLGDNEYPEGRSINRRVMVTIHSKKY